MLTTTAHSEIEATLTPSARALLADVRAATDAGRAFPDFQRGDAREDDIEELAAELLIEPVSPADGGGWRAVDPE